MKIAIALLTMALLGACTAAPSLTENWDRSDFGHATADGASTGAE